MYSQQTLVQGSWDLWSRKVKNGQTYNAQFRQEPSKSGAKSLGLPSALTPTCPKWTWTAGPLKRVQRSYPTIQGFEARSKIPTQGDGPCKKSKLSFSESNCIPSGLWSRGPGTFGAERSKMDKPTMPNFVRNLQKTVPNRWGNPQHGPRPVQRGPGLLDLSKESSGPTLQSRVLKLD